MMLFYILTLFTLCRACLADNITNPESIFHSRPDLKAPVATNHVRIADLQAPGYYMFGAYQAAQSTAYIYDNAGNLVWSGFGNSGPGNAHGVDVCMYRAEPHLCFYQGNQMLGYGKGHGVIMDKHYRIVKSVEAAGLGFAMDEHEFKLIDGGKSALLTIYQPRAFDLTAYGIDNGIGWVQESIFQEIDVQSGHLNFEWRSLDHVGLEQSLVPILGSEVVGNGKEKESPWDYFHINSVEKNQYGDYLISARHTSTIYKISGKNGGIIWKLGGVASDYKLENFEFSSQHDARFLQENKTHTTLSFFDNASNGFNQTEPFSTGLYIVMDHRTKTAYKLQAYGAPDPAGGMLSHSQGNIQTLANGNTVLGWGNNAFWTECTTNGTAVFHTHIALTGTMIYRVMKANWVGEPLTQPSLWTYSKEKKQIAFYVSWNGATEVNHWKFYTGPEQAGYFKNIGTVKKTGFETRYSWNRYQAWSYVEALSGERVLARSPITPTWSPSEKLRLLCDEWVCASSSQTTEAERRLEQDRLERDASRAQQEQTKFLFTIIGISALIVAIAITSRVVLRSVVGKCLSSWRNRRYQILPSS